MSSEASFPTIVSATNSVAPYTVAYWNNPEYLAADDASWASVTTSSFDADVWSYLARCYTFGFAIPAGATITGVKVEIPTYYATSTFSVEHIQLRKADGTGAGGDDRYADDGDCTSTSSGSPDVLTFGGDGVMWGLALTPDYVNDADFGVDIALRGSGANADAYCSYLRMTVYYTEAGGDAGQYMTLNRKMW